MFFQAVLHLQNCIQYAMFADEANSKDKQRGTICAELFIITPKKYFAGNIRAFRLCSAREFFIVSAKADSESVSEKCFFQAVLHLQNCIQYYTKDTKMEYICQHCHMIYIIVLYVIDHL